jgi:hypothetical protein
MATAEKVFQFNAPRESKGISRRWVALLFGCSHRHISRPFTRQGQTYCSCLECGARQRFDLRSWETKGGFHYAA